MIFVTSIFGDQYIQNDSLPITSLDVKSWLLETWGFQQDDFYLLHNGKQIEDHAIITNGVIHAVSRLVGGKGGFGSMLRAIGAQIEKTTNREACRDLSGRRLRDINEEKRLKNWIAQQADRERDAAERKRKKLERLRAEPKHNFQDLTYEDERSLLTEKVSDAVEQGFKVASNGSSGSGQKRKASSTVTSATKKKKAGLWLDPDEDELSSSIDSDDSDEEQKASTSKQEECIEEDGLKNTDSSSTNEDKRSSSESKSHSDNEKNNDVKVMSNA